MADICVVGKCLSDAVGAVEGAAEGAKQAATTVGDFASFWTDPFGNTFRAFQDAAHSLATDVLPALTKATMPDLTQQWWLNAYAVAFALAVFVMVILLLPRTLAVARGREAGADLFATFTLYVPLFLGGAMFGPAAGIFLVKLFGAITDSLVKWGITSSTDQVTAQMTQMLSDKDAGGIAGGAVIGIFLMLAMCVGLVLVLVMLVVQLVTLYFTGILFPLAWVWITSPNSRKFGYKIAFVWLGILASHPLLFLLLGAAYSMMAAQTSVFAGAPSLQRVVTLLVSVIALWVAGFAPITLYRFAPVMPLGTPSGSGSSSGSRTYGDSDLNDTRRRHQRETTLTDDSGRSAPSGNGGGGSAVGVGGGSSSTTSAPPESGHTAAIVGGDGGSREATGPASTSEATAGRHTAGAQAGASGAEGAAAAEGSTAAAGSSAAAGTAAEAAGTAAVGATGIGAVVVAAALAAKGAQHAHEAVHGAVQKSATDVDAYDANGVIGED